MNAAHVWIVEALTAGTWVPVGSFYLTRRDAERTKGRWDGGRSSLKYRVTKYARAGRSAGGGQ